MLLRQGLSNLNYCFCKWWHNYAIVALFYKHCDQIRHHYEGFFMLGQSKLYLKKEYKLLLPERYAGVNLHRLQCLHYSAFVFFLVVLLGFIQSRTLKNF